MSLLCGVKGMSSMKKIKEEMEIETSKFFYFFANMPLIKLFFFKFVLRNNSRMVFSVFHFLKQKSGYKYFKISIAL